MNMEQTSTGLTGEVAAKLRSDLVSGSQQTKLEERKKEIIGGIMSLAMTGTAEEVSKDIGMFQYLRGKHDAFQELLDDHNEAAEQLAAHGTDANIAGS